MHANMYMNQRKNKIYTNSLSLLFMYCGPWFPDCFFFSHLIRLRNLNKPLLSKNPYLPV